MKQQPLQWHPAFQAAMQIELAEYQAWLKYEREHNLTQNPLQIDLLIIKMEQGRRIEKSIGRLFRHYNIIEYKGPSDYLSVNDFYKVTAYACLYQSDTQKVLEIRPEEITIILVSGRYPDKLIRHLGQIHSARMIPVSPGIFYAEGLMFPLQIIQNSALPKKENVWLSRLRPGLGVEEDIAVLARAYQGRNENPLYSAVMELIVRANKKQYEEAKHMCDALRELFADEIEEGRQKGKAEGKIEGRIEGKIEGRIEGKIEGKAEGQCLAFIEILRRKVQNGKTLEESAEALEEKPEDIERLYRLIENQGPDADAELIYQLYRDDAKDSEEKEGQR